MCLCVNLKPQENFTTTTNLHYPSTLYTEETFDFSADFTFHTASGKTWSQGKHLRLECVTSPVGLISFKNLCPTVIFTSP